MAHIEVQIDADTGAAVTKNTLRTQTWGFYLNAHLELILDTYRIETRESVRHRKWRTTGAYLRLFRRESTIPENEVPLGDAIVQAALTKVREQLKVKRWSEVHK